MIEKIRGGQNYGGAPNPVFSAKMRGGQNYGGAPNPVFSRNYGGAIISRKYVVDRIMGGGP